MEVLVVLLGEQLNTKLSSRWLKQKSKSFTISSIKCSKFWAVFIRPMDIRPKGVVISLLNVVRMGRNLVCPHEINFRKDGANGKGVSVVP
jgi:hypothetical protein